MTAADELIYDCPECAQGYRSRAGLGKHRAAVHGIRSEHQRATQRRFQVLRKVDPDHAPPKGKPGAVLGISRGLCPRCHQERKEERSFKAPATTLDNGTMEFIRRRMDWTAARLSAELGQPLDSVVDGILALAAVRFAPPKHLTRRVDPHAQIERQGSRASSVLRSV